MLSDELKIVEVALSKIEPDVDEEIAYILNLCRNNLASAIDTAINMENNFCPITEEM